MTILSDDWFERYLKGLINHAKEKDPMDGYITLFYEEAEDILDTIDDLRRQVGELEGGLASHAISGAPKHEAYCTVPMLPCNCGVGDTIVKEPEAVLEEHKEDAPCECEKCREALAWHGLTGD